MTLPTKLLLPDDSCGQPIAGAESADEASPTAPGSAGRDAAGVDAADLATGVADNLGAFLTAAFGEPGDAGPAGPGFPPGEGTAAAVEPSGVAGRPVSPTPVTLALEPSAGERDREFSFRSRLEPVAVPPADAAAPPVPGTDDQDFLVHGDQPTVAIEHPAASRPHPTPWRQPPAVVEPEPVAPPAPAVAPVPAVTPSGPETALPAQRPPAVVRPEPVAGIRPPADAALQTASAAPLPSASPPSRQSRSPRARRRRGGIRLLGSRKSPTAEFGELPPVDRPTYVVLPRVDRGVSPREMVAGWLAAKARWVITVTDREPELVGPGEVVVVFAPGIARDVRPWIAAQRIASRVTPWGVAAGQFGAPTVLLVSGPSPAEPTARAVVSVGM